MSHAPFQSFEDVPVRRDAVPLTAVDRWHAAAEADYQLCRAFADRFGACLPRGLASRRAGWERHGHACYGILLPDPRAEDGADGDWYLYYVLGETLFRRTPAERARLRMLVLAESADDWAALLRHALRDTIFDARYAVSPDYLNPLGDVEYAPSGYRFTLTACAPPSASCARFELAGAGETPAEAAREACRRWLDGA